MQFDLLARRFCRKLVAASRICARALPKYMRMAPFPNSKQLHFFCWLWWWCFGKQEYTVIWNANKMEIIASVDILRVSSWCFLFHKKYFLWCVIIILIFRDCFLQNRDNVCRMVNITVCSASVSEETFSERWVLWFPKHHQQWCIQLNLNSKILCVYIFLQRYLWLKPTCNSTVKKIQFTGLKESNVLHFLFGSSNDTLFILKSARATLQIYVV